MKISSIVFIATIVILFIQQCQTVSFTEFYDDYAGYHLIGDNTTVQIIKGVKMSTNTTKVREGDMVEVSWEGVTPSYNASDYVALYTPADIYSVTTKAASKYVYVNNIPGFNEYGNGSYVFQISSSRQDFVFAFVQGDPLFPTVIALSSVLQLVTPNEPIHVHLSITGEGGHVVQWNTRDVSGQEIVQFGPYPKNLNRTQKAAYSKTYTPKDLCGAPANSSGYVMPGQTHTAILRDLKPNTKYYYKCGSPAQGYQFSKVYSFRTLPKVGTPQTVYMFATADVGSSGADNTQIVQDEYASRLNLQYMMRDLKANDKYNMYQLHGDISYADGSLTAWDNYFSEWSDFLAQLPGVWTEGNHERDFRKSGDRYNNSLDNSGGECGIPTYTFLYTPNQFSGNFYNLWYSFDYGPIHFTCYSTERDFSKGSEQWNFMVNDIKKVNRAVTPWVVVAGHRPTYSATPGNSSQESVQRVGGELKAAFEDTYFENHVDMVWAGHVHNYEITCPVYKEKCQGYDEQGVAKAPLYMTLGHGGYMATLALIDPIPSYFTKIVLANGYTRLQVNRTHFIQESVYAKNGTVMDTVKLTKPPNWGQQWMQSHKSAY